MTRASRLGPATEPTAPAEPNYSGRLVWEETFDGAEGTPLDTTIWNVADWPSTVNEELAYYTARPKNIDIDGSSNLRIRAYAEDYNGRSYTSGRLDTRGRAYFTYGYIVARIKVPEGQGLWPAFWLFGEEIGEAWWPEGGEVDIVEVLNTMKTSWHSVHGGDGRKPPSYKQGDESLWTANAHRDFNYSLANQYHLYAVKWTRGRLEFFVDNVSVRTFTPSDMPSGKTWPFDGNHGFCIVLNLAVGGGWPGPPDSTTFSSGPKEMLVDWVRVYDTTVTERPPKRPRKK